MTGPAVFFCLHTEYLDILASLSPSVHTSNILTCSRGFPGFPPSLSTEKKDTKGVDIGDPKLGSACAGGSSIKGAGTEGTCIANICTEKACTRGVCTGNTYVKDVYIGVASDESTGIGNAGAKSA